MVRTMAAAVLLAASWLASVALAAPGDVEWVSVRFADPGYMTFTKPKAVSADGRFVLFYGDFDLFVQGDTNNAIDCVVRDRLAGRSFIASVASNGSPANGNSCWTADMTPDGRIVAFESQASNLVPGDTNGVADVFVRDTVAGTTERVSIDPSGAQLPSWSGNPSISDDGRYVVFMGSGKVYLRDRLNRQTSLLASGFMVGNPYLSGDGRFLLYAANGHAWVRNLMTGTEQRVDRRADGTLQTETASGVALSRDSRFVVIDTWAALVPGDTNGVRDLYVRDRYLGTTTRVSVSPSGGQFPEEVHDGTISADGRFVSFSSRRLSGAQATDVFVRDRVTASTIVVSRNASGVLANGSSAFGVVSDTGQFVTFYSEATNLDPHDDDSFGDTFIKEFAADTVFTFAATPTSLAFGNVSIGATSAAQTVTVKNTGSVPVTFTWIGLSGAGAAQFQRTRHCPGTLPVGASCTVDVVFAPGAAGAAGASLVLSTGPTGLKRFVSLSGTGT